MTAIPPSLYDVKAKTEPKKSRSSLCKELPVSEIKADPTWNSRTGDLDIDDLMGSIDRIGLMQPIVVTKLDDGYQVVAGFRRFAAVQKLGWKTVQATIVEADREQATLDNLAENLARKTLRLYDTMRVVYDLSDRKGLKDSRIARETGIKESRVKNLVRVWPRLSPGLKDKWSKIPDATWEPSLTQFLQWGLLSHSEQNAEWSKWSNDGDTPGTDFDAEPRPRKKIRLHIRGVQKLKDIQKMIAGLALKDTDESRIQIRTLKWVIRERKAL